jgi:small subunit ribosomal protein S8e
LLWRLQVRTQTLVKNAVIQVDANPFKQWYQQHYGTEIGAKKRSAAAQAAAAETAVEEKSASNHVKRKLAVRAAKQSMAAAGLWSSLEQRLPHSRASLQVFKFCGALSLRSLIVRALIWQVRTKGHVVDPALDEQFATGRLYACIASRPGQCGRCDGYILEGKELEFYVSNCSAWISVSVTSLQLCCHDIACGLWLEYVHATYSYLVSCILHRMAV